MYTNSVAYGFIQDSPDAIAPLGEAERYRHNRLHLLELPSFSRELLIYREMFNVLPQAAEQQPGVSFIHFGVGSEGLEYEWNQWLFEFESLLRNLIWTKATVHLESDMRGVHVIQWDCQDNVHLPGESFSEARCSWSRDV